MKQNKGIIGLGLILAIVLGVVVVGGGAYYLGKNKGEDKEAKVEENINVANKLEENNSHEVPAGPYGDEINYVAPPRLCKSNTTPWIQVLSPNGGEMFKAGDKITVKWNSECVDSNKKILIGINKVVMNQDQAVEDVHSMDTTNSGSYTWLIPKDIPIGQYEVYVTYLYGNGDSAYDKSDNLITINSSTASTANWKTYTNKELGFEFKYPPDIKFNSGTDEYNIGTSIGYRGVVDASPNAIGTNPKTVNESAVMDIENDLRSGKIDIVDNIKVDGKDAVVVCDPVDSFCEVHITLPKPQELRNNLSFKFLIIGIGGSEPFLKYDNIYQILSTFKFTK